MTTKVLALFVALSACATAPKSPSGRAELKHEAITTLSAMTQRDPGLDAKLRSSAGYAVFPKIGKGGFIAGAAYGRGVLYEHGVKVGPWRLQHVVNEWSYGDHPTYGVVTIAL